MHQDYKDTIKDALAALHKAETQIFTALVNVGFAGQYSDISRLHEIGEVLNLEIAMFEDTGDENLTLLVHLVKDVARVKHSLANLNNIDINTIEE